MSAGYSQQEAEDTTEGDAFLGDDETDVTYGTGVAAVSLVHLRDQRY